MSEEPDPMLFVCYAIIIGFPVGLAWLVNGVEWAVQIGTFACALHILYNQVIVRASD